MGYKLSAREKALANIPKRSTGSISTAQLCKRIGKKPNTIWTVLTELESEGLISGQDCESLTGHTKFWTLV
jgi:hypothetical protein